MDDLADLSWGNPAQNPSNKKVMNSTNTQSSMQSGQQQSHLPRMAAMSAPISAPNQQQSTLSSRSASPSNAGMPNKSQSVDPFANLMSGSIMNSRQSNNSKDMSKMTLAEQQQYAKSQQLTSMPLQQQFQAPQQSQLTSSTTFKSSQSASPTKQSGSNANNWDFDAFLTTQKQSPSTQQADESSQQQQKNKVPPSVQNLNDDDTFGLFSNQPPVQNIQPAAKSSDVSSSLQQSKPAPSLPQQDRQVQISQQPWLNDKPNDAIQRNQDLSNAAEKSSGAQKAPAVSQDELIAKMVNLGFGVEESKKALDRSDNNVQEAMTLIITGQLHQQQQQQQSSDQQQQQNNGGKDYKANFNKFVGKAQVLSGALFQKAKEIVNEQSKKLQTTIRSSMEDVGDGYGGQQLDDQPELFQYRQQPGDISDDHLHDLKAAKQVKQTAEVFKSPVIERPPKSGDLSNSRVAEIMSAANSCKDQGTISFKQGQYGDAEEQYTKALSHFLQYRETFEWTLFYPDLVQLVMSLHNNRAACRLKNGTYKDAVADCDQVLLLLKDEMQYGDNASKQKELKDVQSKALLRKATALENMEKFKLSLETFQLCMAVCQSEGGPGVGKPIYDGIRRCSQALGIGQPPAVNSNTARTVSSSQQSPGKSSAPTQSQPISNKSSDIMNDLAFLGDMSGQSQKTRDFMNTTTATATTSADQSLQTSQPTSVTMNQSQLEMRDNVDAAIMKWKDGKGQNIRALLSTLDQVLRPYPQILSNNGQWTPPKMSELVTTSQVKIKYMKAIAKVHPDKLPNVSEEENLICASVFSALNLAWDIFKAQNGMK
ncbi:hypothetical protein MIR68_001912 [Amoeboaphelidium protococcarum]|nr:hypothetical protein MIR68_001912 [Amoeboaphelidium protococcarum]